MSFKFQRIAIFGSTGGIGSALLNAFASFIDTQQIYSFSRSPQALQSPLVTHIPIQLDSELEIKTACDQLPEDLCFDLVMVTSGLLHDDGLLPEKKLDDLSETSLRRLFEINTIAPMLVAKYMIPRLSKSGPAIFSALSARVGSISDNRLGGWYGYRASKAALNMMIRTLAIEQKRLFPSQIIVGLHPGTVATPLSDPYIKAKKSVFMPEESAAHLIQVLSQLSPLDSGYCFAWDGTQIPF
ncbi:MAG: hypothetical protein CL521_03620 [Actinobacteria bacterium]|nr:hypothetical protein [Actinomycetota bacterium]|tara:strand:+ start:52 stop:774 length:723 start_codon:yes stop_codon:yes gene_type:complete